MPDREVPIASALSPCYASAEGENLAQALRYHAWHAEQRKWPHAIQWYTNIAFLMGQQYPNFRWSGNTLEFSNGVPGNRSEYASLVPRTADNRLIRPHEANVSMLTETKPRPRAEPVTPDPEDIDAAKGSEVAIEVLWEYLNLPSKLRTLGRYMAAMGMGALVSEYGMTDRPEQGDEGNYEEDEQAFVWSPFHLSPDPSATNEDDSLSWFYIQTFCDKTWIQDMYNQKEDGYFPESLDKIQEDSGYTYPLFWWERLKDLLDMPGAWGGSTGRFNAARGSAPNQTVLRTWHTKPCREYPRGRTIVTAGDTVIYAGDADAWSENYPDRWHSASFCRWWTMAGRFWGMPLLSALVPLQKRVNAIDSLVQLNRELMTIGQWLVPRQAKVKEGLLGGIPGVRIPYNPTTAGVKPEKVPHQPMPPELFAERDTCANAIEYIAGTKSGAISSEHMSSALRAGVMLNFLKKEEFRSKRTTVQEYEECIEAFAQNLIIDVSVNVQDPGSRLARRIASVLWKHTNLDPQKFVGRDLRQNRYVKLDVASGMLKSPEAEQERAKELIQYTATSGMLTPAMFVELVRRAGFDDFPSEASSDYQRARRVVSEVRAGNPKAAQIIRGIDDPMIFMEVLKSEIQSPAFARISEEGQLALIAMWHEFYMIVSEQMAGMRQLELEDAEAGRKPRGEGSGQQGQNRPPNG